MYAEVSSATQKCSVSTYSDNKITPFYYGMAEVETELGVQNFLYRIQEGTEFLNNPSVNNFGNSRFYYEFAD